MKERFSYFIFIVFSIACLFGLAVKSTNPEVDFPKKESSICNNLSKTNFASPSILNYQEVKITRQKGDGLFFPLFAFFILPALLSICPVNLWFFSQTQVGDLSYWGQKIQTLSSRSHPPTI